MSTQPEAKQVPLVERLESVPVALRVPVVKDPWRTSFYPVGAMAHEAAAELRRLHAVNAEMLEACVYLVQGIEACGLTGVYLDQARAAIDKAEEVKP